MTKKAEEWIGKVTWMSRVNGQVEVDRGRMVWELLARPSMEYTAGMWWPGGHGALVVGSTHEIVDKLNYLECGLI